MRIGTDDVFREKINTFFLGFFFFFFFFFLQNSVTFHPLFNLAFIIITIFILFSIAI